MRNPYKVMASQWAWDRSQKKLKNRDTPNLEWVEQKISYWVHHGRIWSQRKNSHLFRFEDVIHNTSPVLTQLSDILGHQALHRKPLLPPKLKGIWHSRWNRAVGIHPESTEILTTQKAPVPQTLFSDEAVDLVGRIAGDWMAEVGYVIDPSKA